MGFSRQEFFKILPRPLSEYDAVIEVSGASITLEKGTIRIEVGQERERRLSDLVILPSLPVKLSFHDVEPDEKARFLHRFDHAFMKGLG